jgi:SAM-dependent methyltransferase
MRSFLSAIRKLLSPVSEFSSAQYWERRYRSGGNSGPGSYHHLAEFKAGVLNRFVSEHGVESVVEFGCGDGNQLALAEYPSYLGVDVSPAAVSACKQRFATDSSRTFLLASDYDGSCADLALSLDVIFHLTEDEVFEAYMRRLFDAASRFVIIYSSNQDEQIAPVSIHVRHRTFRRWIEKEMSAEWKLLERIPNAYPYRGDYKTASYSDFYIYGKS